MADPAKLYPQYGVREDGTQKGPGFLGMLRRPDGSYSSELSIGVQLDGKETLIPSMVPTLNAKQIQYLLNGNDPTHDIVQRAAQHAKQRMAQGLSPFKEWGEDPKADDAAARINPGSGQQRPEYVKP